MKGFTKRLTEPNHTDKYWLHTSHGGLNSCILVNDENGSCLHNCVGYAWGRAYEIMGSKPKLSRQDAEKWYTYNDGYERGKEPRLGAIACWEGKGKLAGHVAVVEVIDHDGTITTSNDGFHSKKFWTDSYKYPYDIGSNYTFQGFIYLPIELTAITDTVDRNTSVDQIKLLEDMNVRLGIETSSDSLGIAKAGSIFNYYGVKEGKSSKWYAITEDLTQWVAGETYKGHVYCELYLKETKPVTPAEPDIKPEPTPIVKPINVGDTVVVNGVGKAASDGSGASTKKYVERKMKVIIKKENAKYPYACNQYNQSGAVTAWFAESSVRKV